MWGKSTSDNTELAAALQELEAQKQQIVHRAGQNYADEFMKKWQATVAAPKAKK